VRHSIIHVGWKALTRAVLSLMDEGRVKDGKHPYIYRAHVTPTRNSSDSQDLPTFRADISQAEETKEELGWDTRHQLSFILDRFAEEVGKHLNKVQDPYESIFLSTSPDLEWTVHRTGQKEHDSPGTAGLAIFSVEAIHKIPGAILLPVERVLTYLDAHGKGHHISNTCRTWAGNCQEHLSINYLPRQALVNWIPWADLANPSLSNRLLLPEFSYWYTLGMFRTHHSSVVIDVTDYVARVVSFARTLGGEERARTYEFVELVVAASDWGYCGIWTNNDDLVLDLAKTEVNIFSLESGFANVELGA